MMPSPDLERFAGLVAENVVSAIERTVDERLGPEDRRQRTVGELMRELLTDMPTSSEAVLVRACNRVLSRLPDRGMTLPQVADIDMRDGAVTMELS